MINHDEFWEKDSHRRFRAIEAARETSRFGPHVALFADGGVISDGGKVFSRSIIGGTFAWCLVDMETGLHVIDRSGVILPSDLRRETVTNNNSEVFAILDALQYFGYLLTDTPRTKPDFVKSDSGFALGCFFGGFSLDSQPACLSAQVERLREIRALRGISPVNLQGHPKDSDLETGIGAKRNLPVSIHNAWCDWACGWQAKSLPKKG